MFSWTCKKQGIDLFELGQILQNLLNVLLVNAEKNSGAITSPAKKLFFKTDKS
jgi:hypothetical protein